MIGRIDLVAEATAHLVAVVEETIDVDLRLLAAYHLSVRPVIMIVAKVVVVGLVSWFLVSEMVLIISLELEGQRFFEVLLGFESLLLKVGVLVLIVRLNHLDHFVLVQIALLAPALRRRLLMTCGQVLDKELIQGRFDHQIVRWRVRVVIVA